VLQKKENDKQKKKQSMCVCEIKEDNVCVCRFEMNVCAIVRIWERVGVRVYV
jgi:hypothetical protein